MLGESVLCPPVSPDMMSPMKKILSSTKEFIHKIFILLFSICVFSAALFFAGFIITVGTLLVFLAFDYLLGFVGINLTAIVLSILYGLGLPQNNTIYLFGIPIVLFFLRPYLAYLSKDNLDTKTPGTIYNPFSREGEIIYDNLYKKKKK